MIQGGGLRSVKVGCWDIESCCLVELVGVGWLLFCLMVVDMVLISSHSNKQIYKYHDWLVGCSLVVLLVIITQV